MAFGSSGCWTAAPIFSVVTTSFARRPGLNPLPGFAQTTSGITGVENPLQVAVLPTWEMGGAELHNVVMLILEDANLKVSLGKESYQINRIIGYPVFQALGVVTFVHDGWFEAGEQAQRSGAGARMYMKSLTPVTVCGVEGHDLPSAIHPGYRCFGDEPLGSLLRPVSRRDSELETGYQ